MRCIVALAEKVKCVAYRGGVIVEIFETFAFVDWLAIIIVMCLFSLIIGAESPALSARRKEVAGGLLCLTGGLIYVLMTTDPGQSFFFSTLSSEEPNSPENRKKKNKAAMATDDGRKPGQESSGPGDGAEEEEGQGEDTTIKVGGADIGLKGEGMRGGVAKNGKRRGGAKKKKGGRIGIEGEEGAGEEGEEAAEGESEFRPETDENGKVNMNAGRDCPTCPLMVLVPKGTSKLGADPDQIGFREHEGPAAEIVMRRYFFIGRFEITRGEFQEYLTATEQDAPTGCFADGLWRKDFGFNHPGFDQTDEHPAVCVSRDDAQGYAEWLSKKTKKKYRLPTEAEWEHAARAGANWAFHWGNDIDVTDANFDTMHRGTTPVGRFYPNALRIFDMSGNAWEMVGDCWSPDLTNRPYDGKAVEQEDCKSFVIKGGSWYNSPSYLRLAARWTHISGTAGNGIGFRLVREYELEPEAPKPGDKEVAKADAQKKAPEALMIGGPDDAGKLQDAAKALQQGVRSVPADAARASGATSSGSADGLNQQDEAADALKQLHDLRLRGRSQ